MHKSQPLFKYLTSDGPAQQPRTSSGLLRSSLQTNSQGSSKVVAAIPNVRPGKEQSRRKGRLKEALSPLSVLAQLSLALNPAVTFNPSGATVRFAVTNPSLRRHQIGHHVPSVCASDELWRRRLQRPWMTSSPSQRTPEADPKKSFRHLRSQLPREPLMTRRNALSVFCLALSWMPKSSPASEDTERLRRLAVAVRGSGDGISSWGQDWSKSCSASTTPRLIQSSAASLPPWMEGRWRVKSAVDGVQFPLGRKFVNDRVPGYRMVSVLQLPNIGNTPTFEIQLGASADDFRSANTVATLEAFWPDAKVLNSSSTREGQLTLSYDSPTRRMAKVTQKVSTQLCSSESGPLSEDEWLLAEVWQQNNIEQGVQGEYLVLTDYKRNSGKGGSVRAKQRVAAFLQSTDSAYLDALGKPVALYDYIFDYTRPKASQ